MSHEILGKARVRPRRSTAVRCEPATSTATTMTQPTGPRSTRVSVGSWAISPNHGGSVRILDVETVWSHTVCRVWDPARTPCSGCPPRLWPSRSNLERRLSTD